MDSADCSKLRKQFSQEAQKRITERAQEIKNELHILKAIREMTGMSQEVLAERLEVGQSYISRLERRFTTLIDQSF